MENYVIYEELAASNPVCLHYKGRKRGSISFISIEKYDKAEKEQATNAVHLCHNLRHNNVRGFLEWYETPKHIWIITELCSGGSLNDVLEQDGCLPEPVVWDFLHQLASGLCYLHSSGVLYCDLRPVKILVDSEGTLKYADFTQARLLGVSKNTDQDKGPNGAPEISTNDNRPNVCLDESVPEMRPHTPGAFLSPVAQSEESTSRVIPDPYLPLECAIGGGPTVAGDLWGLGCLLHHLFCGIPPKEYSLKHPSNAKSRSLLDLPEKNQIDGSPPSSELTSLLNGLVNTAPKSRMSWDSLLTVLEHHSSHT